MENIKDVPEQLALLHEFVSLMDNRPEMYKLPELQWFKKHLETKYGAVIPQTDKEPPDYNIIPDYFQVRNPDEDLDYSDEEEEGPKEPTEGVVNDTDNDLPEYGDESIAVSQEMVDKSYEKMSDAMIASSEMRLDDAIKILTEAIKLNPKSQSVLYEERASVFLKMNKPKKAIHDCNKAIEYNATSAIGYKWRGKAYRMLGKWEESYHDLTEACKLDFDDEANLLLKEVSTNVKKLMEHRKNESSSASASGPAGGAPDLNQLLNDPEVMVMFQDPAVLQAFQDIGSNPANVAKYENNPKVQALITKMNTKFSIGSHAGASPVAPDVD